MTIRERLEAARAKGLTDNDLAHWLDTDCGVGKPYANIDEGLVAH